VQFLGSDHCLTGRPRLVSFQEPSGNTVKLVRKSLRALVLDAQGEPLEESDVPHLPVEVQENTFTFEVIAEEFMATTLVPGYEVLGAYGCSWGRHEVPCGEGRTAWVYTINLLLPNRGMDLEAWQEALWKDRKVSVC
jgi:hypothetical protein